MAMPLAAKAVGLAFLATAFHRLVFLEAVFLEVVPHHLAHRLC